MPGIQIPIGDKIDFNLNLGYACSVVLNGGGVGHSFIANIGLGFHKPLTKKERPVLPIREQGFQLTTELNAYSFPGGGFTILPGYKWNSHFSLALGLGINMTTEDAFEKTIIGNHGNQYLSTGGAIIQTFLRGQYNYSERKVSPLASIDVGFRHYSWFDDEEISGGRFYIAPAIGLSVKSASNAFWSFKIGYDLTTRLKQPYNNGEDKKITASAGGVFFKVGWTQTFDLGSKWKDKVKNTYDKVIKKK